MDLNFTDRVAIVTGAGNGLGRSHALELARRGAKVLINDLGGARDGQGGSHAAADQVVEEIKSFGGKAIANYADVSNADQANAMVKQALDSWGRVDVLINNAGILRDKSFAKMTAEDIRSVIDVHIIGAFNCCKAVWEPMRQQAYGRIVMTTSSSGLYGNFGQANYGAAKMAQIGLMNTLVLEGAKYDIRVNALAPIAHTRMTEELLPESMHALLSPEAVTAGAIVLCHEESPNRFILCAGAGGYAQANIFETQGVYIASDRSPETIYSQLNSISDTKEQAEFSQGAQQTEKFLKQALATTQV